MKHKGHETTTGVFESAQSPYKLFHCLFFVVALTLHPSNLSVLLLHTVGDSGLKSVPTLIAYFTSMLSVDYDWCLLATAFDTVSDASL